MDVRCLRLWSRLNKLIRHLALPSAAVMKSYAWRVCRGAEPASVWPVRHVFVSSSFRLLSWTTSSSAEYQSPVLNKLSKTHLWDSVLPFLLLAFLSTVFHVMTAVVVARDRWLHMSFLCFLFVCFFVGDWRTSFLYLLFVTNSVVRVPREGGMNGADVDSTTSVIWCRLRRAGCTNAG